MTKLYAQRKDVFDIDKVTVVGSPTITSDGVASGFSSENNIGVPHLMPTPTKSTHIKVKFNINAVATKENSLLGQLLTPHSGFQVNVQSNNTLRWTASNTSQGDIFSRVVPNFNLSNGDYLLEIVWDGATYKLIINGEIKDSWDSTVAVINYDVYYLGNRGNLSVPFTIGSIDLTAFKIYVDNELVYSPTKPAYALERRKPKVWNKGQFTIVGNPSISESGVASGFSVGNYLQTPATIDFANANSWSLETSFITPNSFTAINSIYSGNISYNGIRFTINATGQLGVALSSVTTGYDIGAITGLQLTPNTKYWSRVKFTGSKYILEYSTDGKKYIETGTSIVSSTKIMSSIGKIGVNNNNNTPFLGSIDLKSFKIYTNNNLVFDGGADTYVYDDSKFTIVGSPTITEYGVATNFSSTSYISTQNKFSIDISKSFEAHLGLKGIKYNPLLGDTGVIRFNTGSDIRFDLRYNGQKFYLVSNGTGNASESTGIKYFSYDRDMDVKIIFGLNSSTFYCKIKRSYNENWQDLKTTTINIDDTFTNAFIEFGRGWGNYMTSETGSIDLSQFSITVDGKEVFTGAKEKFYAMRGGM